LESTAAQNVRTGQLIPVRSPAVDIEVVDRVVGAAAPARAPGDAAVITVIAVLAVIATTVTARRTISCCGL
jgi:hypothetical protein